MSALRKLSTGSLCTYVCCTHRHEHFIFAQPSPMRAHFARSTLLLATPRIRSVPHRIAPFAVGPERITARDNNRKLRLRSGSVVCETPSAVVCVQLGTRVQFLSSNVPGTQLHREEAVRECSGLVCAHNESTVMRKFSHSK